MANSIHVQSDKVFTADIRKSTFSITFDVLQSWRDLADRTLPLKALLQAEIRIRSHLKKLINSKPRTTTNLLTHQLSQLAGFTSSTTTLQSRIQGVIDLLTNTIDIRNQEQSADLNGHLYNLTQDTVDDSASVRVITFLSLLYLPASFVGTLFGMNLFVFDTASRKLVIAKDFWIYALCFVPLTLITVVSAWVWKRIDDNRRAGEGKQRKKGGVVISVR